MLYDKDVSLDTTKQRVKVFMFHMDSLDILAQNNFNSFLWMFAS